MSAPVQAHYGIYRNPNLAEQIARIERAQEQVRQFAAEQHKIMAEQSRLLQPGSLWVGQVLTPTAAVVAAVSVLIAAAPVLARWLGS